METAPAISTTFKAAIVKHLNASGLPSDLEATPRRRNRYWWYRDEISELRRACADPWEFDDSLQAVEPTVPRLQLRGGVGGWQKFGAKFPSLKKRPSSINPQTGTNSRSQSRSSSASNRRTRCLSRRWKIAIAIILAILAVAAVIVATAIHFGYDII